MEKDRSLGVRRMIVRVGREALWAPILVLVSHSIGAKLFGHEPYVDPIMHFLGGMAAAFFFLRTCEIGRKLLGVSTLLALDLMAFGLTCAVALLWESGEFFSDQFLGTNIQKDVADTMGDLLLGVLGAVLCLTVVRVSRLFPRGTAPENPR